MPKVFVKGCKINIVEYGDHCQHEDFWASLQKSLVDLISYCISKAA